MRAVSSHSFSTPCATCPSHLCFAIVHRHANHTVSSRVPQIAKNRHTKCEGLSVALFLFAVMGNVTYILVSGARERLNLSVT